MTVIVAVRLPGEGAVLAADGRVTQGTEIITDVCEKLSVCGSAILGASGQDGCLLPVLEQAKNWQDVVRAGVDFASKWTSLNWNVVGYDRKADQLWYFDWDGSQIPVPGMFAAIGCGGTYALGYMDARPKPRSLEDAAVLARAAVKATCKRDALCGGRVRLILVRGRRGAIEIS